MDAAAQVPASSCEVTSRLRNQVLALDSRQPGTHGPFGRSAEHGARGNVELAAVTRASYRRARQYALRERAPQVRASVIEVIDVPVRTRDADFGSRDDEYA